MANAHVVAVPMALRRTGTLGPFPNQVGIRAILDFISTPAPAGTIAAPQLDTSSFRAILFTDLADHTAMMQRLGDARGREVLREHERITRETLAANGGTEVKAMGDGFMASFGSAQKALECATALQRAFASREQGTGKTGQGPDSALVPGSLFPVPIRLHIGVNAGEPIAEDDDLFGSSVILAARAASKATGGQVLVTNVVRELVAGKGFVFADAGEFEMRGFEDPVRLYELRWQA
jgi:class 3 adenylate cyclase